MNGNEEMCLPRILTLFYRECERVLSVYTSDTVFKKNLKRACNVCQWCSTAQIMYLPKISTSLTPVGLITSYFPNVLSLVDKEKREEEGWFQIQSS